MEKTENGTELYDWDDFPRQRQLIFDNVKTAFENQFPKSYGGVRMELHDAHYVDPEEYSLAEQKSALMGNKFLHRRLRGTLKLFDEKNNVQLDEKPDITLMRVPYLTERGTFIHAGNEYTHSAQSRLLPGVYTRKQANGIVESHFNTRRGTGRSFRISLEPDTGLMKMDIGQSSLRLYSLLHDLGVPDEQLEKSWGPELLAKNREKYDARVFDKAHQRLVNRADPNKTREEKAKEIKDALAAGRLDRAVIDRTLPNLFNKAAAQAMQPSQQEAQPQQEFGKDDYQMLANFLNQQFHLGIPLDAPVPVIVQTLIDDLKRLVPGVTPEGLHFALSQKKKDFDPYDDAGNSSAEI